MWVLIDLVFQRAQALVEKVPSYPMRRSLQATASKYPIDIHRLGFRETNSHATENQSNTVENLGKTNITNSMNRCDEGS